MEQLTGRGKTRPRLRDVSGRWQGEGVGCFSGELELSKTKHSVVPAGAMELLSCVLLWKLVLLQSECERVGLGVGQ